MPARQSTGGGGKPPAKTKTPKAAQPAKRLPMGRQAAKNYGSGAAKVFTTPRANPAVTQKAVKRINTQVGRRVFKTTLREPRADIVVKLGHRSTWNASKGPFTSGVGKPGTWTKGGRGHIAISPYFDSRVPRHTVKQIRQGSREAGLNPRRNVRGFRNYVRRSAVPVREHELGHTVGLAHPGPKRTDPYLGLAALVKKKQKRSSTGIMGVARRLNSAEVAYYRALAASQRTGRKPHGSGKKAR